LEEHVEAVNALLKDVNGLGAEAEEEDDEWGGIEGGEPVVDPVDHEEEYIDEDRYTTVTVEVVDVSKEGLVKVADEDSEDEALEMDTKPAENEVSGKKVWPKKPRKQKFRYESKAERKFTRGKQKAGNKARADARRGNG
jgi:ribosomal RNA-processing protein 17